MSMKVHQRAPRTPDSYFNVSESVTLLNIVKSDRIQTAFQSNRKNHSSVWEMVANILNRYNEKKRSSKQCCNRYENLKKIYTQLKRNPEKHVRRNWPYMGLFKEIEDQRGESWGANQKRIKTESYYQRRRALMLMNNNSMNLADGMVKDQSNGPVSMTIDDHPIGLENNIFSNGNNSITLIRKMPNYVSPAMPKDNVPQNNGAKENDEHQEEDDDKDDHFNFSDIAIKKEYPDHDYDEDNDNSYMHNNYNGHPELYMNGHNDSERNILHPDVIVDTDHVTDTSSISMRTGKRKMSTSTDAESTNYELIEYLKRREKRDEEMFKRMEEREERLIRLLERTVVAIEHIASQNST